MEVNRDAVPDTRGVRREC